MDLSGVTEHVGRDQSSQDEQSDTEECDREDEEAFTDQVQFRGLPYESGLRQEDALDVNDVYSVAPAEGQKPIVILTDQHFE